MAQTKDKKEYLSIVKRMKYVKIPIDKSTLPEAEVRQKLAKNRAWQVCTSYIDTRRKMFCYNCLVNSNKTEDRTISFDEVCEDFHWKSFKLSKDGQAVKFSIDPNYEDEVVKAMKRAKKNTDTAAFAEVTAKKKEK